MAASVQLLAEEALETARLLSEVRPRRGRVFNKHKMSRAMKFRCPVGFRKDPEGPQEGRPRCVKSQRAVGGQSKLVDIKRHARMRARTGQGRKSRQIGKRWRRLRAPLLPSRKENFAGDLLRALHEERGDDVRISVLARIEGILALLSEEFDDDAIETTLAEAWDGLDPMVGVDDDVFIARCGPAIRVIAASLSRLVSEEKDPAASDELVFRSGFKTFRNPSDFECPKQKNCWIHAYDIGGGSWRHAYAPSPSKMVGHVSYVVACGKVSIDVIGVEPEYQRRGIATELVRRILNAEGVKYSELQWWGLIKPDGKMLRAALDKQMGASGATEEESDMGTMRDVFESAAVPRDVALALRSYARKVRDEIRSWDMGDPGDESDAKIASDVWDTARHAGWSADDVVANPGEAVRDVLAIWKSK